MISHADRSKQTPSEKRFMKRCPASFIILFLIFFSATAFAADRIERDNISKSAEIVSVNGEGWMRFIESADWRFAVREQVLTSGDAIKTGEHGRMGILFLSGIQIKVNRNTLISIQDRKSGTGEREESLTLGLEIGEIWSRSKTIPNGMRIRTPSATAAIRGTDWDIRVDEEGTSYLTVIRGSVDFSNDFGSVTVLRGEQAVAEKGKSPRKTVLVTPSERIQWIYLVDIDLIRYAEFYSHRKRVVTEKLAETQSVLDASPQNRDLRLLKAGLLFDQGQYDAGLGLFNEILENDPSNDTALVYKGMILLKKAADPDMAAGLFDKAMSVRVSPEALVGKAEAFLRRGDWDGVFTLLKSAESIPKPIVGLAKTAALAYTGDYAGAEKKCREYQGRFPEDERFPVILAAIYLAMDEVKKARREIESALAIYSDYGPAFNVLAAIDYLEGNAAEAEAASRKALRLDPSDTMAMVSLGGVLTETGRFEEAEKILEEAVLKAPDYSSANAQRGYLSLMTEKTAEAQKDFNTAYAADPTNHTLLNGKALALLKEGKVDEAIRLLLISGTIEPKRSQTHSFLAIAYHQKRDFEKALAEIQLAEELDPKDSLPYYIANLIYQDIYMPFKAITASRKALELLPFQKSLNLVEDTKAGTANVGSALLGLGMQEWSDSFAQEGYDSFRPSSHFQAARRYHSNYYVNASELLQGLILAPMANYTPSGYGDIIRRPRHDTVFTAAIGDSDDGSSSAFNASVQGYTRTPLEIAYSLSAMFDDQESDQTNDFSKAKSIVAGVGIKPDYKNAFHIGLTASRWNYGDPGTGIIPDPDDEVTYDDYGMDLGYTHRFGFRNVVLGRASYNKSTFETVNPHAFGSGMGDYETSFIMGGYTLQETRDFFERGIYDISTYIPGDETSLATDSTGYLENVLQLDRLSYAFPVVYDEDAIRLHRYETETSAFQFRHMLGLGDHELSWGMEYIPFREKDKYVQNEFSENGDILFTDEPLLDPDAVTWSFPLVSTTEVTDRTRSNNSIQTLYITDRFTFNDRVLIEAALFGEHFDDRYNDDNRLYPRVGAAIKVFSDHVIRFAYQQWLEKPVIGTLSPLAAAGLVPDYGVIILGARIEDFQTRFESRWTDRFFTVLSAERVNLTSPEFATDFEELDLYLKRAGLAVNALLTDQLGAYLRVSYEEGEYTAGVFEGLPLQYLPERLAAAGLVWVSPEYVKVVISENYIGPQYVNYSREMKLPGFFTTDLSAVWEPIGKRMVFSLSLSNVFNKGDPASARSLYFSAGIRF